MVELGFAALAVLLGTMAQAATGFGFALIAVPVISLATGPASAVLIGLILPIPVNLATLARREKSSSLSKLYVITLSSCVSLPVGVFLLNVISPDMLHVIIGAIALVLALSVLTPSGLAIPKTPLADVTLGFASGVASSTTGMGGPLLALVLAGRGLGKDQLRTTMSWYLIAVNSIAIAMFAVLGSDFAPALARILLFLPFTLLGMWLGRMLFRIMPERTLVLAAVCLAAGAGTLSIAVGLKG